MSCSCHRFSKGCTCVHWSSVHVNVRVCIEGKNLNPMYVHVLYSLTSMQVAFFRPGGVPDTALACGSRSSRYPFHTTPFRT